MPVALEMTRARESEEPYVRRGRSAEVERWPVVRRSASLPTVRYVEEEEAMVWADDLPEEEEEEFEYKPMTKVASVDESTQTEDGLAAFDQPTWTPPAPVWYEPTPQPCTCAACVPARVQSWDANFQRPPWEAPTAPAPAAVPTTWGPGPDGGAPTGFLETTFFPAFKKKRRRGRRGRGGRGKKKLVEEEEEEPEESFDSSTE